MPRENECAWVNHAASEVCITVPSPRLRGEGDGLFQHNEWGEGDSRQSALVASPPHPIRVRRTFGVALSPQAGRGHSNNGLAAIAAPRNDAPHACPCSPWMPMTTASRPQTPPPGDE